ncbi:MAG: phosphoribosylformylglycinamidine synthase II [Rhodobacteraceae bacterium]|nr:phosphoribosylformylglycinamidine synthase II [Paracoccaceae bacterium]
MSEPAISEELIAAHGLNKDEYQRILNLLNRTPTFTELGIFSAMWNEHCSYKSSKKWLRTLPTTGENVICGPGENAGIVDIGDGQAVVFKMESHNHPSFIEPYQGAATGMGGILRDVFTMGARPIAAMNSLSFGELSHPKTKSLVNGVVEGIGGYGNSFGVPTIGGELRFDKSYNGNCLVNAFAAGLVKTDKVFYSAASGIGMPVVYLGAKTGRDGVGGATMASAEFDDNIEEKRPTVQVGDPFTEKCLMEATLELMDTGAVISIQDMGAAGLTCSAVEMGDKGNLGIELNLDNVPIREENMTAYEMMLSESQERMLMVLDPELEKEAKEVFKKWDLDFAIVGKTIAEDKFEVWKNGEVKASLPLKALSGTAPEYDRPYITKTSKKLKNFEAPKLDPILALKRLLQNPNFGSKSWVYQQYDHMVMADTIRRPGKGAGIVRVHKTSKALAFTSHVNPRYCQADPFEGGKQAVAEAYRNLISVGAKPLAATDNLNFGNPEKPEIMGQFVNCIRGISEACKYLNVPIVSGNVSLYNETDGEPIQPTPTIGAVGLIEDLGNIIEGPAQPNDVLILIGEQGNHLQQSALLSVISNNSNGQPPITDLEKEKRNGEFILNSISYMSSCKDLGQGGIALGAFKMAIEADIGVSIEEKDIPWYFGEDQGRYLLTTTTSNALILLEKARNTNIKARIIGSFGGGLIKLGTSFLPYEELKMIYSKSLELALE